MLHLQKILVPLDGSREAESVLPYVRDLAPRFGSQVQVLGVGIGRKTRRVNRLLEDYLNGIAVRLRNDKINAEPVFSYGLAADKILDFAGTQDTALIIMATHGRSGITRWWMGSIAEKVISQAAAPVLLVRSKRPRKTDTVVKPHFLERILVPLDGSDIGEAALSYVEALAMKTGASIDLLQVVSLPSNLEASLLGGPDWRKFVKAMHDTGENYLKDMSKKLLDKKIKSTYEVTSGDPADKIVEYAEEKKTTLIAMSTHGRTGLTRWVLGSVADKVLHDARIPVLLVRSPKMVIRKPKA
jgi:nucleotide-binding universal stress UspA family protein